MISILIPAYNEERRIEPFLDELKVFLKGYKEPYEVILIDDGSVDKTVEIVRSHSIPNLRTVSHEKNRGKGKAIKTGIMEAKGEKIIFLDADGATSPKEIPMMSEYLEKYDFVAGNRKMKGSKVTKKQPLHRIIASFIFNTITRALFDIGTNDALCGFKGVRRELGKKLAEDMISDSWEFDVELLARARKEGCEIGNLPIEWRDERGSRLNTFKDPPKMLYRLIKLRGKL